MALVRCWLDRVISPTIHLGECGMRYRRTILISNHNGNNPLFLVEGSSCLAKQDIYSVNRMGLVLNPLLTPIADSGSVLRHVE